MPMLTDRPTNCFDLFWTGSFHQLRPAIAGHWSLKLNQTPLVFQKIFKMTIIETLMETRLWFYSEVSGC